MSKGIGKLKVFFAWTMSFLLVLSSLFLGIVFEVPNVEGGQIEMTIGEVDFEYLTDYGRILQGISWEGSSQTVVDAMGFGYIGLVVDHDGYDHTPGAENIADSYSAWPYASEDDFTTEVPIDMIFENGTTQISFASFKNSGAGTGNPDDLLINQTAWSIINRDWAIIQWRVLNIKGAALTGMTFSIELPLSKDGARYGVGGGLFDGGDDVDGFDAADDIYWAQDDGGTGTCLGFASAVNSKPINHYFSKDYHSDYDTEYKNFFANDTWLYERTTAANSVEGNLEAGNRTANIGWNGVSIDPGEFETFTLIIAANDSFNNMKTAVSDARYYYDDIISGFQVSEFSDEAQKVEVYSNGKEETNLTSEGYFFSIDDGVTPLPGNWDNEIIPTFGYATFTFSGSPLVNEGDTFGFYRDRGGGDIVLIDGAFSYGQEGIIPDPVSVESTGRHFDTISLNYTNEWLRSPSTSWSAQNGVGNIVTSPNVVLNRVMFNPLVDVEGYVELMYTGSGTKDISGWTIVCDDVYTIPVTPSLSATAPFYVFKQSDMPSFFTIGGNMDAFGDNVYLYNTNDDLMDMVGWSSAHSQGKYMGRVSDGTGTYQGFNDASSTAAGWSFDRSILVQLTEFFADPTTTTIELYNPRGGDKVLNGRWSIESAESGGALTFTWNTGMISANGGYEYSTGLLTGTPGDEGDTLSLFYDYGGGPVLMDSVSYGVYGEAPDPLSGESIARYWDPTFNLSMEYTDEWSRDATSTFGSQNDIPPINSSSLVILNEIMFNPSVSPDGKYFVIINRAPSSVINISGFIIVSDAEYVLPSYPTMMGGFDGQLYPEDNIFGKPHMVLISFADDTPTSDPFFNSLNDVPAEGDNVYLYDTSGRLLDMVGWDTQHLQGMSAKREPDGFGTHKGYNDTSSETAGWVFDSPLQVLITEISDDSSTTTSIEIYNPLYPTIDFSAGGYTFENSGGFPLMGVWMSPIADKGQHSVFDLVSLGLDTESDSIKLYQNGYLVENISYGLYGPVPDPLPDESVQRYFDGDSYAEFWGRNWTSGPNFGWYSDIPAPNLTSRLKLNEVMFYPNVPTDGFVEVMYTGWQTINISGYKLVCDKEYIIQNSQLDTEQEFYYLLQGGDTQFFLDMDSTGDNVYLYDDNGSFIDMVGWSSQHTQGMTVTRVPDGNGTRDGYDDTSSVAAGWVFNRTPSVLLIRIINQGNDKSIKFGDLGEYLIFNLTVTNYQSLSDIVNITNSTDEGWQVEIFNEDQTQKISEVIVGAFGTENITIKVTLPDSFPFAVMDNVTIQIKSTNNNLLSDSIVLNPRILGFIHPEKSISPSQIYVNGTGHDEVATITLNLTGYGASIGLVIPQDIIFCVDTSGSMDPISIDLIKEGLNGFVDHMFNPDQGALISYGGTAVLMNNLTQNYTQLKNDIDSILPPNGGTMMVGALQLAIDELDSNGIENHIPVIILFSDGAPTDGTGDDVRALASQAAGKGIRIYTIGYEPSPGFGTLDEQLLMDVANITGAEYYYAPSAEGIADIYITIAEGIVSVAGYDPDIIDNEPMVRDVLPPWVDVVPGTFSIPPDVIYTNATGYQFLEWNISSIGLGETWSVSFDITSVVSGNVEVNNYTASRIRYTNMENTTVEKLFPLTMANVLFEFTTPSAPINLIATPGLDFINLSWNAPLSNGGETITNYRIYRGTSPGSLTFYTEIGNLTTFNDTGVVGGIEYYYQVSAVNIIGEGPRSNEVSAIPFTIPSAPVNLAADAGDGFINLSWEAPASNGGTTVTGYYIYRNGTVGIYAFIPAGQLWFNDTNVINGLTYTYNISALNAVGEGPNATISATPLSLTFPSACENLQATAGIGYIELTWDPPISNGGSPIINYRIYKGTSPGSETFYMEIGNITDFNDTSVTPGTPYYYKVSAVNSYGEGPLSNEATATPPTVPLAPFNLIADEGIGYVVLTWNEPSSDGGSPITNYKIYRGTSSPSVTYYDTIGNITTYNDTGVIPQTTYYYRVSAVNLVGESSFSNEVFVTPPAYPTEPQSLVAVAGNGYIVLTWDEPGSDGGSPIIAYRIYKGPTSGSVFFYIEIGNITTFNDTSVTSGITYYYKVSAVTAFVEGPLSNDASATPPNVPFAPLNLEATSGIGYIDLIWDEPSSDGGSPITNYRIYRGTVSGSETFLIIIGNLTTYNDIDVSPGTTYFYRVSAVNIVGEGTLSNEASATPPTVPSAPLNLTASTGDGYIYLSWEVPTSDGGAPIIEYCIYRNDITGIYTSVPASQLWYNDTSVVNDVTYTYYVSALNEVGEGPNATVSATPFVPIIPSPPVNLMVSPGNGQVNMTWDPPSDGTEESIVKYNIYRNGTTGIYATVPSHQLWFIDQNITPGVVYTYEVASEGDDGEGVHTMEVIIKGGTVPSVPTDIIATSGDSYVVIIWTAPDSDGGYQIINYTIYKGTISGEEEFFVKIGNISSFNDTDVENQVTYHYKIIAVNEIGESGLSESTFATPLIVNEPPSVKITSPLALTTIKGKFEILGTSTDPDNAVQRVEIKIDDGNWERAEGTTSWNYEWDTTSVPNGLHKIIVRAYDGLEYSQEINVTILIDNQDAEKDPMEGIWPWLLVVVVVIFALLFSIFWYFRRRSPKDMPDGQIYEIIQQKFEEGEISKETFEDFKRRYKTD